MNKLNIVAFLILMQNGEGVMEKSPGYIMEKFERYCLSENPEYQYGLDMGNKAMLELWRQRWDKEYVALKKIKQ